MSILIKGMEMPKDCDALLHIHPDGRAVLYPFNGTDEPHEFTAVPVPLHYDLIDHTALKIAVMDCDAETRIDFLKHAMDCINKAPVVIPSDMPLFEAEEGE